LGKKGTKIDQYYTDEISHKIDRMVAYNVDDPIDQIHHNGLDPKLGHIYLIGEESYVLGSDEIADEAAEPGVEYTMANRFIKNMNILMRKKNVEVIFIHMKTCGGDWGEGMAIYNMIKACPTPVIILNYTHARSMSSIIFSSCRQESYDA